MKRKYCRHCRRRFANRPRGLCWACYYGYRHLYPVVPGFGRLDLAQMHPPRPARAATAAYPGTAEKINVLAARVEAGENLWHARDAVRA